MPAEEKSSMPGSPWPVVNRIFGLRLSIRSSSAPVNADSPLKPDICGACPICMPE